MIEKGGLVPLHYHLIARQRGTGPNLIRMTRAPRRVPAETPTDRNLTHDLTLEEAQDQGLHQSPHHVLQVNPSPDLVPSQSTKGQPPSHQGEQFLS